MVVIIIDDDVSTTAIITFCDDNVMHHNGHIQTVIVSWCNNTSMYLDCIMFTNKLHVIDENNMDIGSF